VGFVRSQTFRPRPDLDLLFVAVDIAEGRVIKAWLVPSESYAATLNAPDKRGRYKFAASMKDASMDRWGAYRLDAAELAPRILALRS
jgi:hypothetical protein